MPEQTNPTVDTPTDSPTAPDPVTAKESVELHTGTADPAADAEPVPTGTADDQSQATTPPPAGASISDIDSARPLPVTTDTPTAAGAAPTAAGATTKSLTYAVDIVFCIDVTGSMTPIIDAVKANALRFFDDVQTNLTDKGKNVDELRVRIIAFRDLSADDDGAMQESSFFTLPGEQRHLQLLRRQSRRRRRRRRSGIGSGSRRPGDQLTVDVPRRPPPAGHRGVDRSSGTPAELRSPAAGPGELRAHLLQRPDRPVGRPAGTGRSQQQAAHPVRPGRPGWSDISASWENVVHHPSQAGGGLSDVDYGTIIDSIGNSV